MALWVLGAGDVGGVGRHALDVAERGIPGWWVQFVVEEGSLAAELRRAGATVVDLPGRFGKQAGTVASWWTLRRIVNQLRPDLVHTHLSWADVLGTLALLCSTVPLVTTEHGVAELRSLYNSLLRGVLVRRLHRWRLRRASGFIAVSQATLRSANKQWGPLRVPVQVVQPNGVDPVVDWERPRREGLRVGTLCRLAPEKRVDLAVLAFASLYRRRPDARFCIGGSGVDEIKLRAIAQSLGLGDVVTFVGNVHPRDFWPKVDIVVQLSAWENCSYTLLDGLRYGRGVVATDVGGNREFLPRRAMVGSSPTMDDVATAVLRQENSSNWLPVGWPTVCQMTNGIAKVYDEVMRLAPKVESVRPSKLASARRRVAPGKRS